jgi:hypothetical protein
MSFGAPSPQCHYFSIYFAFLSVPSLDGKPTSTTAYLEENQTLKKKVLTMETLIAQQRVALTAESSKAEHLREELQSLKKVREQSILKTSK